MILLKTLQDIEYIMVACEIWKKTKKVITEFAKVGVSLLEIDEIAKNAIINFGGEPAFKNYMNFPGNICISRNEVIIHGIPDKTLILPGDKITFDMGVKFKDRYCDAAFTMLFKPLNKEMEQLNDITYKSLINAVKAIKKGERIGIIGETIKKTIMPYNYVLLRDFSGHGCGIKIHEDPYVRNDSSSQIGPYLKAGMTLCIEPMVMTGDGEYDMDYPQWNVRAKNKKAMTCHWEHMILINELGEANILTA